MNSICSVKFYLSENYLAVFSDVQNLAEDLVLISNFTCEYVGNLSLTLVFLSMIQYRCQKAE